MSAKLLGCMERSGRIGASVIQKNKEALIKLEKIRLQPQTIYSEVL